MSAVALLLAASSEAAELVWQPTPQQLPGYALDPNSVSFGQGAVGRAGYRSNNGTCWQQIGGDALCPAPGVSLQDGVARSASGGLWYTEIGSDHTITWTAPDGRSGAFPPFAGDEHVYPHDDGSADASWYSPATQDWQWGTIGASDSGAPANAQRVTTTGGNFGLFWTACASPSATFVFSGNGVQRGFGGPYTQLGNPPFGTAPRRFCQTIPGGVAFADSVVTADTSVEAIRVGRVADDGTAPLPVRLDRDRDPGAVVDRLDGFAALGSRWYLTYRHQQTADSPVEVFYKGSDNDGATWSDWAPMTDPVPTSGNVAVLPDGRLAWLARDGSYSLWAYPATAGDPVDSGPGDGDPVVTTVSSPCQGGQVAGLPANFECGRQPTVKLPGSDTFVPLDPTKPLPDGAKVDATGTSVNVTVAADGETPRTGTFSGAVFIVHPDPEHAKATVQLTGGQPCSKKSRASSKPKIDGGRRKLWANARGGFTTRGHFLSATELGTRWLTQDDCKSTTVTVVEGAVRVKPNGGRSVIVRAGHSFTAKQATAKKTKKARRKKR